MGEAVLICLVNPESSRYSITKDRLRRIRFDQESQVPYPAGAKPVQVPQELEKEVSQGAKRTQC